MAGQQYGNGNVKMPKGMRQEILTDTFTPRAFQVELLDVARERNTIVCLGTGMGKTFIAVMLIKELSYQIHGSYNEGGKRTIFLVTTVPLVDQQGGVIKRQTNLSVGTYIGAMGVDLWSMRRWQGELASHHVLVMTAQIFLDMLLHGFVQLSRVNLLVMDECHHATGAHPYREIMRCQDVCALADRPLVLGLTASILNATCHSPAQLEQLIISLETTLRSAAQTTADMMSTDMYATRPQEVMMHYSSDPDCALIEVLAGPLNDAANFISAAEAGSRSGSQRDRWTIPRTIVSDCTYILYTLGPWCAGRLAKNLSWQLSKSINKECDTLTRALLNYTSTQLRMLQRMVDMHFDDHVHTLDDFISLLTPRTVCLVEIIRDYRPPDNFYIRDGDPANMDIDADHTDGSENSLDLSDSESQAARNSWCKSPTKKKTRRRAADKSAAADKMEYVAVAREVVTDGTEAGGKEEDALCGIIFVDRRNTAFALAKLLDKLCEWDESLFFLHSRHITGSVSGVAGGEHSTATQLRQQEQALRQFRQRDVNLLVSTSVLEEGVDVPRCNLVVRFDLPATYRSYIQSKGRARSADSKYYMLVDEKDVLTFTAHLKKFKGIEKVMTMRCQSREEPEEEAVEARMVDTLLPPYFPVKKDGAPRVTMSSAISLVNRYCAKLPSDSFTHLTPKCKITEEKGDEVGEAGEEVAKMYSATLQLPINSPVKQEIQGKKMATKKLAKMAVALVACEILHKAGELDEHLLPVGKEIIKYEDEENEWEAVETAGQARPGTTKRKQYYSRRVAHDLTGRPRPNQAAYLHAFNMKLTCPVADELNTRGRQVYAPEQTTRSFGILSEHPITSMPLFPVFTRSGQVTLSVDLLASDLVFSERQLDRLTAFHRFIFRHVMRLERDPMIFNPAEADAAYIVVPLNKDADADLEIDWTFVEMIELQLPKFQQKVAPASASSELFVFDEAAFCDAVVMPSYRNIDQPEHFYVAEVRHDLSPLSAFPSETYRTFEHYYCSKYGLPLTAAGSQPLLDVDYTSARLNLLTPRHLNQKGAALPAGTARRRDSLQQKQMLVPELCRLHPVPASLWRKAVCLPTILYRLNQLLLADELRALIGREAGVGAPALPPTHRFSPLAFDFREPNGSALARVRFDAPIAAGMYAGPSPCLILQTLTMSNANDFFSLERLETIGDSFLKFSVTAYLYCQYPRIHEGRLSYLRSKQVSNYNLYRLGRQHRLADCMVAAKFEPAENWLPPGFTVRPVSGINVVIAQPLDKPAAVTANGTSQYDRQLTACTAVEEAADRSIPYNLQTQQSVPDKSVADCVEALIGCYLTSCGQHAALRLMTWLGLDVLPGGGGGGSGGGLPQPDSPLLHEVSDPAHVVKHQLTGYEMFEETIGYKFEDRSYLLQAFTHASYHYNRVTDCYQRLEFLGDAILDYVITRQLFEDPKKHSPGILTDLRSALVNNNMFAALAVKWDFHKYLKFVSPPLFTVIEKFVERQKSLDDEINLDDEFGDTADEDAVDDGEDIEIPKALGDIFESVAGAIYLDSNMSLDTVWRVYHRMMKPLIDTFTEKIPKSPVRALLELEPETAKFQKPERTVEGKIRVSVNVVGKGVFKGIGRNHRIAKSAAAKRALKVIRECHAEEQKLQVRSQQLYESLFVD